MELDVRMIPEKKLGDRGCNYIKSTGKKETKGAFSLLGEETR